MSYASVTIRSGKITTGGQAQQLAPYEGGRNGFSVQNQSSADLWVSETGQPASAGIGSLRVPAGGYYETPPNGCNQQALSIFGATTDQAFYARTW